MLLARHYWRSQLHQFGKHCVHCVFCALCVLCAFTYLVNATVVGPFHSSNLWVYMLNCWTFWSQHNVHFSANMRGWQLVYAAVTALCETGALPQLLHGKFGKSRQQNPCTLILTLHREKWPLLWSGARDLGTQCTGWMGSAETHAPSGKHAGWCLKSACRE